MFMFIYIYIYVYMYIYVNICRHYFVFYIGCIHYRVLFYILSYPCCHTLLTNLIMLTKTEYKIVVVVITVFTICCQNYMEKLSIGLKKKKFILRHYQHKSFSIFFLNFQTILFKIYETLRKLPFPQSTMLRMRANT